ncbi:hypothetical protein BEWA_026730 [Theileria equi strain WA]|uniref:Uncharacterized protein n=1 Tax=Theileria equi strain WA TaxID=1537102 RepID=L0AY37_THEEQ|nr:hypothetical protein BEWA_026730 [Theileria equi strain WA]AFZ79824.1 hypothetical protein BEWA_026730 [Theileria equi strain WA]|eukprot:XP_004829490.1 hypothetical protein BEWA_026730 [Theileria equi strain WA]
MVTLIDISKKCNKTCKCYVNQDSGVTATREENITHLDKYGCCAHNSSSKKLVLYWNNIKLETTSGIPFAQLDSVTTYYHNQYEPGSTISRPLIIRVKEGNDQHWYENAGHHVNKKWREIANIDDYPKDNNYDSSSELKKKLTEVGCRLYGYHQIDIQYTGTYDYQCPICQERVSGSVVQENHIPGVSEYTRYRHSQITEKSILTHNGKKITYKRKDNGKTYFLPIPINDVNIKNISAYYWDGDNDRDNPLLIEIGSNNGDIPFWFENIREIGEKNEKWRQLGRQESTSLSRYGDKLQEKLNFLNCYINKVVEIKFGVTKCHGSNTTQHKNRIDSVFTRILGTSLISSYEYTPSGDSRKEPFIISKFIRNYKDQEFPLDVLPLREVEKLIYYISPCDISNPFLVYVKAGGSNNWYKRTDGDTWEEDTNLKNKPLDQATNDIIQIFERTKGPLNINGCPQFVQGHGSGIQLDIAETPYEGHSKEYKDGNISIIVTKTGRDPRYRFFKNTHTATKIPFDIKRELKDNSWLGSMPKMYDVQNIFVYFWEGNPTNPILVGVTKKGELQPKYYGKGGNKWLYSYITTKSEIDALDDQNCKYNEAIPFDIKDPLSITTGNSNCLNNTSRQIISNSTFKYINENADYFLESFLIRKKNARISRVIFHKDDTNIEPPANTISQVKMYYWSRKPSEPLMVEFKPSGGDKSVWFERVSISGTVWKPINERESEAFYSGTKKSDPTQQFINKLDTVSCRISHAVKIDISKKDIYYCHDKCTSKRIIAKKANYIIPNYIVYEHTSAINGHDTFILSSIYNGGDKQDTGNIELNMNGVTKVTVYFPECNPHLPFIIRMEQSAEVNWLKRKDENKWENVTGSVKSSDILDAIKIIEGLVPITDMCKSPVLPLFIDQKNDATVGIIEKTFTLGHYVDKDFGNVVANVEEEEFEGEVYKIEDEHTSNIPIFAALKDPRSGIIIDIRKRPTNGDSEVYILDDGQVVKIEMSDDPPSSGFWKFKHTKNGEKSFKVNKVEYDNKTIDTSQLQISDNKIEYLSVWYWKHSGMLNPLFIEVKIENGEYRHIKNFGDNNWVEHTRNSSEEKNPFQGESLEQLLDDLNCKHNNAVTMNLSWTISMGRQDPYCCRCDYHGNNETERRITVREEKVPAGSIPYYKHSISGDSLKLAGIKYYENGYHAPKNRRRIKLSGQGFPLPNVTAVCTFYCKDKPVIIYVDSDKQHTAKGWYKKGSDGNNGDENWVKVSGISKDPENIRNCTDKDFKQFVKELDCSIYKECNENPQPSPQGSPGLSIPDGFGKGRTGEGLGGENDQNCYNNTVVFNVTSSLSGYIAKNSNYLKEYRRIEPTRSPDPPPGSNYEVYQYSITGPSEETKISKVTYKNHFTNINLTKHGPTSQIRFYSYPGVRDIPLMLEFLKPGGETSTFYENTNRDGTGWIEVGDDKSKNFYSGDKGNTKPTVQLSEKLDEVLCKQHGNVTINLTRDKYNDGDSYCCSTGHSRVSVTENEVSCKVSDHKSTSSITAYKHSITGSDYKLAGIYYTVGLNRRKISITGLDLPTNNSVKIYAFYCQGKDTPVLIYVKDGNDSSKPGATGWYRRQGYNSDVWIVVYNGLSNKTPDTNLNCKQWNYLVGALKIVGCENLGICNSASKSLLGLSGASPSNPPDKAQTTSSADNIPPGSQESAGKKDYGDSPESDNTSESTPDGTTEPTSEAKAIVAEAGAVATGMTLGSILGTSSGTLAGAGGLTGLGWWMFKRSKGDPWVRQI